MKQHTNHALDGMNNKRLDNTKATNSEETSARSNEEATLKQSNVSIPAEYDVEKAKNWVDNGSRL